MLFFLYNNTSLKIFGLFLTGSGKTMDNVKLMCVIGSRSAVMDDIMRIAVQLQTRINNKHLVQIESTLRLLNFPYMTVTQQITCRYVCFGFAHSCVLIFIVTVDDKRHESQHTQHVGLLGFTSTLIFPV